jgi:hypothetical protein
MLVLALWSRACDAYLSLSGRKGTLYPSTSCGKFSGISAFVQCDAGQLPNEGISAKRRD